MYQQVREKLRRLDAMRQAVESLPSEIARLQAEGQDTAQLRKAFVQAQLWVDAVEQALQVLTPQERLIADWLFIYPDKGNVQRLCGILGVEQSSIYRRRAKVLQKLETALYAR